MTTPPPLHPQNISQIEDKSAYALSTTWLRRDDYHLCIQAGAMALAHLGNWTYVGSNGAGQGRRTVWVATEREYITVAVSASGRLINFQNMKENLLIEFDDHLGLSLFDCMELTLDEAREMARMETVG